MHAWLWIKSKNKFLQIQKFQPCIWFRYNDNNFFISAHDENSPKIFMMDFNNFNPNIKFIYEFR